VSRAALLALLLLAACTRSNLALLDDLEEDARARPRAELDDVARRLGVIPPLPPVRAVSLPMQRTRLPTVRGRVNGVEMPLLIDTGSTGVWISGEGARRCGLYVPPGKVIHATSPGFRNSARVGAFERLELGELRFGAGAATVPLAEPTGSGWTGLGTGPHGIVGCALLSHFRVTFDFSAGLLRLEPHRLAGYVNSLWTRVEVNGRPFLLLVDSGASRLVLEPWAALELGLISGSQAARHASKAETARGARFTSVRLDSVKVAGRTFRDVKGWVALTFGSDPARDGERSGGLLGLQVFGKLSWTLDFGARKLSVEG
jgi:predicted aspartyl protease